MYVFISLTIQNILNVQVGFKTEFKYYLETISISEKNSKYSNQSACTQSHF